MAPLCRPLSVYPHLLRLLKASMKSLSSSPFVRAKRLVLLARAISGARTKRLVALLSLFLMLPCAQSTEVVFQNGLNGYNDAEDTTLHGAVPKLQTANFGADPVFGVAGVKHGGFAQLGLIRFNNITGIGLDKIPTKKHITKATLELYKVDEPKDTGLYGKTPEAHREIRAFKMLTDWKAGTAMKSEELGASCFHYRFYNAEAPTFWGEGNQIEEGPVRNIDFQFLPRAAAPLEPNSGSIWMSWDVTAIAQEWIDDPTTNHGLFLNALGYYVGAFFASCEHDAPEHRPRLVIEY